ncbi:gamma-glutamylcyclotransferase [Paenibacillus montanisoli]|uniref:Gamma-glutamylcyclotransferase n=1 Tax=Paenibacillus montanisoli TaxID=2081970 RepID=A0A328U3D7_9BACL|nr:gamma-glutamylcyclotransferase [Paenibacillus montanisoli]
MHLRTLLPGLSNHHVVAGFIQAAKPGIIHGRLVDYGPYPALLRDEAAGRSGSVVRGLWIAVNRQGLRNMDQLEQFLGIEEDNDYDRIWVTDIAQPEQSGWVYVWDSPRGCPPIDESYWPDYYARKQKGT